MNELNLVIANNLIRLRKQNNLTQLQLANQLNYSDKAISKWEKGTCVPSVEVLMKVASFYGVRIEDILYENRETKPKSERVKLRVTLSLLSCVFVWLIATIIFVILFYIKGIENTWLCFIIPIPITFLILLIFSVCWKQILLCGIFASFLVWTTILAISLVFQSYNIWLVYIIGLPLQILTILSVILSMLRKK